MTLKTILTSRWLPVVLLVLLLSFDAFVWGTKKTEEELLAMPSGPALSSSGSSQQAVSPPNGASITIAGEFA